MRTWPKARNNKNNKLNVEYRYHPGWQVTVTVTASTVSTYALKPPIYGTYLYTLSPWK